MKLQIQYEIIINQCYYTRFNVFYAFSLDLTLILWILSRFMWFRRFESQKLKFNCLLIIWGDWNPNFYLNFCLIDIFHFLIECFVSRIGIFEIGILLCNIHYLWWEIDTNVQYLFTFTKLNDKYPMLSFFVKNSNPFHVFVSLDSTNITIISTNFTFGSLFIYF